MNYLGMVAILKDEPGVYLDEWLRWHRHIGIERFILFDNGSAVPLRSCKDVEVFDWPGASMQMEAYNLALLRGCGRFEWLAFLDLDEFIVPWAPRKLSDMLDLASWNKAAAVALHWQVFGSNGQQDFDGRGQIERFTRRAERGYATNQHIKSIVRPHLVTRFDNPHFCPPDKGLKCLDEMGLPVPGALSAVSAHGAWINHYHFRSKAEYARKLLTPRADTGQLRVDDGQEPLCNAIEDTRLLDLWNELEPRG